ncbi:hypothetical protein HYX11_00655 [Candidatus Woesearchaeota archaeon]|nr:hypothetical protein [Candidatus Woesearchaeota archaeon]
MDSHSVKLYQYISLGFSAITIGLAIVIYLVTYIHQDVTSKNLLIFWTVQNHLSITIGLIILSGFIGYTSSTLIYKQVTNTKKESQKLLEMLFLFLNKEEKEIINYLVQKNGMVGQAEISRLPNMNRVKAYRSLQKMQEKNLIDIAAYGKVRKVSLKDNILTMLTKK